jgi:hypothetical protein
MHYLPVLSDDPTGRSESTHSIFHFILSFYVSTPPHFPHCENGKPMLAFVFTLPSSASPWCSWVYIAVRKEEYDRKDQQENIVAQISPLITTRARVLNFRIRCRRTGLRASDQSSPSGQSSTPVLSANLLPRFTAVITDFLPAIFQGCV